MIRSDIALGNPQQAILNVADLAGDIGEQRLKFIQAIEGCPVTGLDAVKLGNPARNLAIALGNLGAAVDKRSSGGDAPAGEGGQYDEHGGLMPASQGEAAHVGTVMHNNLPLPEKVTQPTDEAASRPTVT